MKLILLSETGRESRTIHGRDWRVQGIVALFSVALMVAGGLLASAWSDRSADTQFHKQQQHMQAALAAEQQQLADTRAQVERELQALTVKVATLQARIIRLDALGERVAQAAKLDKGEFDFSQQPAVGGPELGVDDTPELTGVADDGQIYQLLASLETLLEDREHQLTLLDRQLMAQELRSESYVTGRPVKWGWMSSAYGHRTDPFTKKRAWHGGVDFAGKAGGDVIAVASGVVTESGRRYGYGNMVEINHGNGVVTRYAHNASNEVAIGDVVEKGSVVAKMGSTGRSTGPHVHFEVLRHGKPINPERYIYRASL